MENPSGDEVQGTVGDEATAAVGKDIDQHVQTTNVNVYPIPGKKPRRRARKSGNMAATVDQIVIQRLNEHDAKLAKLEALREADKTTRDEFYASLREDVAEVKQALKPVLGLGILAQPQSATDKEEKEKIHQQNRFVIRLLVIMAILFGVGVLSFFGLVLWLAINRV